MAPIRIGFIGLSASKGWATSAHIPYLKDSNKYQIVALANSSVNAAKAAVEYHKLPASTKTYGDPTSLANDPDVELVVCSVRVDKHYDLIKPALLAGKDAFVEWPLGATFQEAEELTTLAKEKNVKTAVGLQGRMSPLVAKIRQLVTDGKIGDVLSTTIVAAAFTQGPQLTEDLAYSADIKVGGNMITISFGHLFDCVTLALGDLSSFQTLLANRRPKVDVLDSNNKVVKQIPKTSHDQLLLQGVLASNSAPVSIHMRGAPMFKNEPSLLWRIHGTKGELRITAPMLYIQLVNTGAEIQLHDFKMDEISTVDWVPDDAAEKLPEFAKNVARLYEAFADGKGVQDGVVTFEESMKMHQAVEEVYKSSEEGRKGVYV